MEVMIGVDPHKGSHTATMLDRAERELARIKVRAGAPPGRRAAGVGERLHGRGRGRWSALAGWAICSPSSSSPPARRCWTCRRRWRHGCGCSARASRPRPIRTTPARSPWPRCTPRRWRWCDRRTMSRCAGCWPSGTPTWPAGGPSCAAGCTPWSPSWCPAGSTKKWSSTRHDHCSTRSSSDDVAAVERHRQAVELVDEIEHLDVVSKDSRARITAAVAASATTLTEIFGVGPIVACMLIGYSGDPTRFTTASRYAAYTGTAPIEFSSGGRDHPPAVAARQPPVEPRPALRGDHPDPPPPQPRPRLLRTQARRRQHPTRSDPRPQAPAQRHRLAAPRRRRPARRRPLTAGPGRTLQERLCRLRDRLTPEHRLFGEVTTRTRTNPTTTGQTT